MKVAVIGAGVSGLVCAYKLSRNHQVTVYEKNSYAGGHTNTHQISSDSGTLAVDSGFIVFNKKTYPHFVSLLEELDVAFQPTSMSFSVRCEKTGLEYNGTDLNGLFAQRRNLINPGHYSFLAGILSFNRKAKRFLSRGSGDMTLGEFVRDAKVSPAVVSRYLIPMASAVWSADPELLWSFPASFILKFWENHGFLEVDERPVWYVIRGGSARYVSKLTASFRSGIRLSSPVERVSREVAGVRIRSAGRDSVYDQVIMACHPDQTLGILADADSQEARALRAVKYQRNRAVLHTDPSVLPRSPRAHAAWNYFLPETPTGLVQVHYHMNILQSLDTRDTYIVSLNPDQPIREDRILRLIDYDHPVFSPDAIRARDDIRNISGRNRTFFAGAWLRNGFHEDGVLSALHACRRLESQEVRCAS